MKPKDFLDAVAQQLIQELTPTAHIKTFTSNPAVIGAYAEAAVRSLVARIIAPLRVCTGAIIGPELCADPKSVPQIDTIIWDPSPCPAIFSCGEFGLVPQGSCFGILEIKRSLYSNLAAKFSKLFGNDRVFSLVSPRIKGVGIGPSKCPHFPALGVVCLREPGQSDRDLRELIDRKRVVVLLEPNADDFRPNPVAVFQLLNFLISTRQVARTVGGCDLINLTLFGEEA